MEIDGLTAAGARGIVNAATHIYCPPFADGD
jgi:hypothetical protein